MGLRSHPAKLQNFATDKKSIMSGELADGAELLKMFVFNMMEVVKSIKLMTSGGARSEA